MATIQEILQEECTRKPDRIVLFLEGKFWKAYEQSAYALNMLFNFKPSKRFVKLVGKEVISIGFPQEQLQKYLPYAEIEDESKKCRSVIPVVPNELAFLEWKSSVRIKETNSKVSRMITIPEEWKPKTQLFREENLPVFKMVYDLLLRIFHDTKRLERDYRYTLGEDLKRNLLRVEICIYHGNVETDAKSKLNYLAEALDRMLEVKLCVRILHDSKQISTKNYALLSEQMVMIEKHLRNWIKYHNKHCYHEKVIMD